MKLTSILAVASLSLAALTQPAMAQTMDHGKMGMTQDLPMVDAEVRRVDKENGKVTLKHGAIKNMDMPPMTMVFTARDKAMLEGIAVGDKVQFTAVNEKGQMLVESIKAIKP
ncbi:MULTISPECIES: copper-binding protein [Hydrogenophaga]|jgi:Cu(I)/Ag(I) efflux system periplasmic protein CusF|uniref:Copper-binding protein n=1 Tax=Hydrogenophaga crocea TaxID=2716225 RepID=A0A6G8IKE1_9BURK|nr:MULTISPECIES: copper-binding protein [Hydrogenophaga]OJV57440.1 MAG: copper-binding protein [Hydrogenophaga sp. 70-12]QIM53485.1 copper-binding protein [Hydrogenophaga crocea]